MCQNHILPVEKMWKPLPKTRTLELVSWKSSRLTVINYPSFSNFSPPAIQCTDEMANNMVSKLYKAFRQHQQEH
jgi:hypothetical protein